MNTSPGTNRYFIFLGVLFYMVVCLVPFSTRFLTRDTLEWYAIMMYGINLSLCNLTLYAQWSYGTKRKTLIEREIPAEVKKEARFLFLLSPVVIPLPSSFHFRSGGEYCDIYHHAGALFIAE
ncbi:MAG: hypothetical protein IPP93_16195 [Chitinophagaceae bacterium]|nr:hypothetical protein [Chitinophagaceae bacterium]